MLEYLQGLSLEQVLLCVTSVISVAATLAALTPSPKDDGLVAKLRKMVDFLALNFGNAKNEEKK